MTDYEIEKRLATELIKAQFIGQEGEFVTIGYVFRPMTEFMDARHVQDILLQQQGATYFALHCFPNSTKYHCTFEWMSETYQAYRVETGGFHTEEQAICMIAIAYLDAQDKKVIAQLEQMKEEDEDATK